MKAYLRNLAIDKRSRQVTTVSLTLSAVFFILSLAIRTSEVTDLDRWVTHRLQSGRSAWLLQAMVGISWFGDAATLIVLALIVAAGLLRGGNRLGAGLTMASLIGLPLNLVLKEVIGRPRPDASVVEVLLPAAGLSFPSGHAMASMSFYGFVAALAWMHLKPRALRWWAVGACATLESLVATSRIYLGAHWLSDVIAGATAGMICVLILVEIYRWRRATAQAGS